MPLTRRLLRRRRLLLVVVALSASTVISGCGDDDDTVSTEAGTPDGAALYEANCASCHGSDLRGTEDGPPHLSVVYAPSHHPDEAFRSAIERGAPAHHWSFGDMPPVEGLDAEEVDAVISYVREQQEIHGLEPYPPR